MAASSSPAKSYSSPGNMALQHPATPSPGCLPPMAAAHRHPTVVAQVFFGRQVFPAFCHFATLPLLPTCYRQNRWQGGSMCFFDRHGFLTRQSSPLLPLLPLLPPCYFGKTSDKPVARRKHVFFRQARLPNKAKFATFATFAKFATLLFWQNQWQTGGKAEACVFSAGTAS